MLQNQCPLKFLVITFVFLSFPIKDSIFVTNANSQSKLNSDTKNERIRNTQISPEEKKILEQMGILSEEDGSTRGNNFLDLENSDQRNSMNQVRELNRANEQLNHLLRRKLYHQITRPKWLAIFSEERIEDAFLKWNYFNQLEWHIKRLSGLVEVKSNQLSELPADSAIVSDILDDQEIELIALETPPTKDPIDSPEKPRTLKTSEPIASQNLVNESNPVVKKEDPPKKISSDEVKVNVNVKQETINKESSGQSFARQRGKHQWPVEAGIITDKYGLRKNAEARGLIRENYGIDMQCPSGSSIKSVFEGTVILVAYQEPYEWIVTIKHGNFTTAYYFLNTTQVKVGDHISKGAKIGTLKSNSEKVDFHFEIWEDQDKVNPELWLKKR